MSRTTRARRAFSLLEAVIVVMVLAISVPPTVAWIGEASRRRADAVNTTRATTLATCVMEHVLADAASQASGLGFSAFADTAVYLDTPVTGLRARLASITQLYEDMGMAYTVQVGPLSDENGLATGVPAEDVFRTVTVTVTFNSDNGGQLTVSFSSMVAAL